MKFAKSCCALAIAVPLTSSAGWITGLAPGAIRLVGPTGDVTFGPTNTPIVAGCLTSDFYVIKSSNNAKMGLAILLTAKSMGKTVKIYVNDSAPCDAATGRPNFSDIGLED